MDNIKKFSEQIILEMIQEIERKDMPQVKGKDVDEVLKIFDGSGIGYEQGEAKCSDLKPVQDDFIPEKLESLKKKIQEEDWVTHPLFVSKEGNILDGHHRWLAYKAIYGDDFQIPVTKVDLPLEDALKAFDDSASDLGESRYNATYLPQPKKLVVKEAKEIKDVVAVVAGRFQPFHKGHYSMYELLAKKFGKKNTYISTSNIVAPGKSPFNFMEKKQIISKMFGIPKDKIVKVKSPFKPVEIVSKYDPETTAYVTIFSEKDVGRLGGKYFKKWTGKNVKGYNDEGYFITAPVLKINVNGKNISGTQLRTLFGSDELSEKGKKALFKKLYGKFDQKIFDLMAKKLSESVILGSDVIEEFLLNVDIKDILLEASQAGESQVDDGPATFYKHPENYHKDVETIVGKLGWQVIDYLAGSEEEYAGQRYKYDHVSDVSFGDVGVRDTTYPDPIAKYKAYMTDIAVRMGYSIVDWLMTDKKKDNIIDDPESEMATKEPLVQDTSDAAKPLEEQLFSKEWWTVNVMTDKQPLKDIKYSGDPLDDRILLQCGGAFGHLAHPFDDMDLTFGELRMFIENAIDGKLESVQEKIDGQNIMVSWKDGKLIAARNKGHIKNFGAEALSTKQISDMFAGRGAVHDAFTFAMQDLEKAISKLSDKQKTKVFGRGKNFMNIEVVYPATTNVIPYDFPILIFHGAVEYDEDGNPVGRSSESARMLDGMIRQINQEVQANFTLSKNPIISLPKTQDFSNQKGSFVNRLNKLKGKYKLKDTDKIIMYHQMYWEDFIVKQAKKFKYKLPNSVMTNLVKRWAYGDKSYKISDIKKEIDNEKFLTWVLDFDKTKYVEQVKKNLRPFELLFLELGAQVLKNLGQFLAVAPDSSKQRMKKELEKTVKELEATNDVTKMKKLKVQLDRLNAIGGFDAIVPTEGITFQYKGKLYKLTGTFAPINRIMGSIKFG